MFYEFVSTGRMHQNKDVLAGVYTVGAEIATHAHYPNCEFWKSAQAIVPAFADYNWAATSTFVADLMPHFLDTAFKCYQALLLCVLACLGSIEKRPVTHVTPILDRPNWHEILFWSVWFCFAACFYSQELNLLENQSAEFIMGLA